jgi:hypothetical protein
MYAYIYLILKIRRGGITSVWRENNWKFFFELDEGELGGRGWRKNIAKKG